MYPNLRTVGPESILGLSSFSFFFPSSSSPPSFFIYRVLLYNARWIQTCDSPASASCVLGVQSSTTPSGKNNHVRSEVQGLFPISGTSEIAFKTMAVDWDVGWESCALTPRKPPCPVRLHCGGVPSQLTTWRRTSQLIPACSTARIGCRRDGDRLGGGSDILFVF